MSVQLHLLGYSMIYLELELVLMSNCLTDSEYLVVHHHLF